MPDDEEGFFKYNFSLNIPSKDMKTSAETMIVRTFIKTSVLGERSVRDVSSDALIVTLVCKNK